MKKDKFLELLRKRYRLASDYDAEGRAERVADIRFLRLREQWEGYAKVGRNIPGRERPMLVIDRMMQYRNQVINEIRQNTPSPKVRPVDDEADVETAKVFEGIIRHSMDISDGDIAIDTAAEWQVDTGLGWFYLEPDWASSDSWDQELYLRRAEDPMLHWHDPADTSVDGSRAEWHIMAVEMKRDDFEAAYPDADLTDAPLFDIGSFDGWITKDTVRVAKYWWIKKERTKVTHPGTGETVYREKKRCFVSLVTGTKELERTELLFNGEVYIPVFPVYGLDVYVEGKRHIEGLIRNAKDAQRMLNYAKSASAEHVALVTKSPWIGTAEQFENCPEWDDPNTPWAKMVYNPVSSGGQLLPQPSRNAPPQPNNAWIQIEQQAIQDIQASFGMYEASVSANPNQQSGKALLSLQRQASQGTFHFSDNLARTVRQLARVYVSMIPKYYDARTVARIIGEDGAQDTAQLNPNMPQSMVEIRDENGSIKRVYNLAVGKFDVVCDSGPSYATKRQESADASMQLVQAAPQIMGVAGDLIVSQMDWPMADQISKRIKNSLPPNIVQDDKEGSSPELMQAQQQMQQMAQQMEEMSQMVQQLRDEREIKAAEIRIKEFEAETKRMQAMPGVKDESAYTAAYASHNIEERRLALDFLKAERDYKLELMKLKIKPEEADAIEDAEEGEEMSEATAFSEGLNDAPEQDGFHQEVT